MRQDEAVFTAPPVVKSRNTDSILATSDSPREDNQSLLFLSGFTPPWFNFLSFHNSQRGAETKGNESHLPDWKGLVTGLCPPTGDGSEVAGPWGQEPRPHTQEPVGHSGHNPGPTAHHMHSPVRLLVVTTQVPGAQNRPCEDMRRALDAFPLRFSILRAVSTALIETHPGHLNHLRPQDEAHLFRKPSLNPCYLQFALAEADVCDADEADVCDADDRSSCHTVFRGASLWNTNKAVLGKSLTLSRCFLKIAISS